MTLNLTKKYPLSDEDINTFLGKPIHHPQFKRALKHIQKAHSSFGRTPLCCYVIGEPGVGKTTLAETAQKKILVNAIQTPDANIIPVVFVTLRSGALPSDVRKKILEKLGVDASGYSGLNLENLLTKQLIICGVRLIIFDEFHHLLRYRDKDVNKKAANFIKTLIDENKIPVVLLGIPDGKKLFELHKELHSRFVNAGEIEPMSFDEKSQQSYFQVFIEKMMSEFPIDTVDLSKGENLERLFLATGGNLRQLEYLISEVLSENRDGKRKLMLADYQKAYEFTRSDELYNLKGGVIKPFDSSTDISVIRNKLTKAFLKTHGKEK